MEKVKLSYDGAKPNELDLKSLILLFIKSLGWQPSKPWWGYQLTYKDLSTNFNKWRKKLRL